MANQPENPALVKCGFYPECRSMLDRTDYHAVLFHLLNSHTRRSMMGRSCSLCGGFVFQGHDVVFTSPDQWNDRPLQHFLEHHAEQWQDIIEPALVIHRIKNL